MTLPLTETEQEWAALQPFLKSRGYMLRRRYQPGFNPAKHKDPFDETWFVPDNYPVLDAVRSSDRAPVVMKLVQTRTSELTAHLRIQSLKDSRKHTVPIYDIIPFPDTDTTLIIVLPSLRRISLPAFTSFYEFLECVSQLLEGLDFLHSNRVAHKDVDRRNIHMDCTRMFPKGWHFVNSLYYHPGDTLKSKAVVRIAPWIPRCLALPNYLYLDFGRTICFGPDEPCLQFGKYGTAFPPEMHANSVIDPYKVDVYCLGIAIQMLLENEYADQYAELRKLLAPLVDGMLTEDPEKRPSARQALDKFRLLVRSLSDSQLRKTLIAKRRWSSLEIRYSAAAILLGEGDERILFAKLRGDTPPEKKSFFDGSFRDKAEVTARAWRFFWKVSSEGNILEWLAPKQTPKT